MANQHRDTVKKLIRFALSNPMVINSFQAAESQPTQLTPIVNRLEENVKKLMGSSILLELELYSIVINHFELFRGNLGEKLIIEEFQNVYMCNFDLRNGFESIHVDALQWFQKTFYARNFLELVQKLFDKNPISVVIGVTNNVFYLKSIENV
jgi:hypothetical protein